MIGSANEIHLNAFREHPEFPSFRGRFELLRAPVPAQLPRRAGASTTRRSRRTSAATSRRTRRASPRSSPCSRACASPRPSATPTRSRRSSRRSPPPRRWICSRPARPPERLDADAQKVLRAGIEAIYQESQSSGGFRGARRRLAARGADAAARRRAEHRLRVPLALRGARPSSTSSASAPPSTTGCARSRSPAATTIIASSATSPARACSTRSRKRCAPRAASSTRRATPSSSIATSPTSATG